MSSDKSKIFKQASIFVGKLSNVRPLFQALWFIQFLSLFYAIVSAAIRCCIHCGIKCAGDTMLDRDTVAQSTTVIRQCTPLHAIRDTVTRWHCITANRLSVRLQ